MCFLGIAFDTRGKVNNIPHTRVFDVLDFNTHVFPEHLDSFIFLAKLYLQQGDRARADSAIQKVLTLDPDNDMAQSFLLQQNA